MMRSEIPEFAVVGHPNEGKSSVLSTLAEDDSVRISPLPGDTRVCRTFPVVIDGREVVRFTDTPGFQNPRETLQWIQAYQGSHATLVSDFIKAHQDDDDFHDDCQLLQPLLRGALIIFVVDGSRPLRNVDRAEMEILRLLGCPRMAIVNCKREESAWLAQWQMEFRKSFNAIRLFNSCQASYRERIELLESLKSIDQEIQPVLERVVKAFAADWQERNRLVADLLLELLCDGLGYRKSATLKPDSDEKKLREKLHGNFVDFLRRREKECQEKMRALYKHNIFNCELPQHSILQEDLFSEKTWKFLGLSPAQFVVAGALGGAALGAAVDVAAAGLTFGIFSSLGALLGAAGSALLKGGEFLSGVQFLGFRLNKQRLQVGPVKTIQLLFVLLDRQLLFYSHIINWAHGRRDYENQVLTRQKHSFNLGYTRDWSRSRYEICENFFKALQHYSQAEDKVFCRPLGELLREVLREISGGEKQAGKLSG
ncbi:MAG: GTPase/DUF3482 domain-containing protein [Deltaproteobacteria bacterium]|nr:GTPase/DUF3482 domain-containing protein [Deltaproteobacteria bacterium]